MKNILKFLTFTAVVCMVAVSCDYDDTNFELLTNNADPNNTTHYFQFANTETSYSTGFDPFGDPVDFEETVSIGILGNPLSQDVTVNLSVDPASTATANMYELGSTSIVIPAGTVYGETSLKSVYENMPIDETVTLIINMDADPNPAIAQSKLTLSLFRPAPCSWIPGVYTVQMSDSFGDGWQTTDGDAGEGIQVTVDGVVQEVGMCSPYATNTFVCSPSTDGGFNATGTITIPEGAIIVKWYFPGDWWGEIGFKIIDPNGVEVYSVAAGEGVAGIMPFEACTNK